MKGCEWILVFSALALVALAKDWIKCYKECGGDQYIEKAHYEGIDHFCYYVTDINARPEMLTKCEFDCLGEKPEADQIECLCNYCKHNNNYQQFCKQPGINQSITWVGCDAEVCTGNGGVKFHGRYCSAWDEEEFKEMKDYYLKE